MGSGMRIFSKRGYGDRHYGTLPNRYPFPSLAPFTPFEYIEV